MIVMMYQYSDSDENKSVCQKKKMEIKVLRLFVNTAVILSYSFQKKRFQINIRDRSVNEYDLDGVEIFSLVYPFKIIFIHTLSLSVKINK
jgi:hypothetical protein